LKHEKDGLEEYLRSMKHNMNVIQTSIEDPALSSYLAMKPKSPYSKHKKGTILELIDGETGKKTTYGQSRSYVKPPKDKFEFDIDQFQSPKTKIPEYAKAGNFNRLDNEDTWKNLGKYKILDKH
jgi:hypothetical protein